MASTSEAAELASVTWGTRPGPATSSHSELGHEMLPPRSMEPSGQGRESENPCIKVCSFYGGRTESPSRG